MDDTQQPPATPTPSEQPKQENSNLNAGNPGAWAMKWKTPEERKAACLAVCEELRQGYPKEYLYAANWDTIERYMKDFPEDFPSEAINDASKDGKRKLLSIGYTGMVGKLPGFNARTWEFVVQNMTGWKLRTDMTTKDEKIESPVVYIPKEEE